MLKFYFTINLIIIGLSLSVGQNLKNSFGTDNGPNLVSIVISDDGKYALTTNNMARIFLWNIPQKQKLKTFVGQSKEGNLNAFAKDGKNFIAESSSGKLILWEQFTYKPAKIITDEINGAFSVHLLKNHHIFALKNNHEVLLCDEAGKKLVSKKVSFSASQVQIIDKNTQCLALENDKIFAINCNTLQEEQIATFPEKIVEFVALSAQQIYALGNSGTIYSNHSGAIQSILEVKKASHLFISPNQEVLAVSVGKKILFYDAKNFKNNGEVSLDNEVQKLLPAPKTSSLFVLDEKSSIHEYELSLLGVKPLQEEQLMAANTQMRGITLLDETTETARNLSFGKYYALIIGIDAYTGQWTALNNAVSDAQAIVNTLNTSYHFDEISTLYNAQATRENIIKELEKLIAKVKPQDNVFIYYSGHGDFKQNLNKGYWVPVDAHTMSTFQFISNSDLQTYIGGITSKHTLLISDACFSGDIFRGGEEKEDKSNSDKYLTKVHNLKSRRAITSGGIEPVMDGGKDGHSVFAYYLLQTLKNNQNSYLDADLLFESLKIPVVNNSEQVPNYNTIKNTGDEGGQFIFIKK